SLFGGGKGNLLTTLGLGAGGLVLAPELQKLLGGAPGQANLNQMAEQFQANAVGANTTAATLEAPLTTGVLPAGQQAALDAATRDSITTIKSKYASMGLSGSSMEADAISSAQVQANAQ